MNFQTLLIHHRGSICKVTGAVSPPIYQVSTFRQEGVNKHQGFEYSRGSNPTRQVLEDYIADLEGGAAGFAFASGMAAISSCFMLLKSGDHVVATEGLYGGTYRVLSRVFKRFNISYSFVDTNDPEQVEKAFQPNTSLLYLETPSNPLMSITDIRAASEFAHSRGALVAVDNTFMSPYLQRPLEFGADLSLHSASKFLGGHSDVIAGLVVAKSREVASQLKLVQTSVGAVLGPQDSWLVIRGMKTLAVRMAHSQKSAQSIAEWLRDHPDVEQVFYPGLPCHPGGHVHASQASGAGAILSFKVRQGLSVEKILGSVRLWSLAVSLGAVESIITQPAHMTHSSYPAELRKKAGVTDNLLRLSVGLEDPDDLIGDLEQAIAEADQTE